MAPIFSEARPDHLLIRALGEDRAARQAADDAARLAHEDLARHYRERAAKLSWLALRNR